MNELKRLLSIKEAANYIGRSENALRILICRNELTDKEGLLKDGRRTFFDKNKLDRYLDSLTANG